MNIKQKFGEYGGSYLYINLSTQKSEKRPRKRLLKDLLEDEDFYLTCILFCRSGTNPLSLENALILSASPLTGIFGDANKGGHFPSEIKHADYDFINNI
ncbi:MAG: hypothetical protein QXV37_03505 [Candidatus Jordarchaeaceae archaeon]